jgi:signal transduction histidine kinase
MFHVVDPNAQTTGVGLAIVRKIVEMHGGSVSVASAPDRGADFRFTVPKRMY